MNRSQRPTSELPPPPAEHSVGSVLEFRFREFWQRLVSGGLIPVRVRSDGRTVRRCVADPGCQEQMKSRPNRCRPIPGLFWTMAFLWFGFGSLAPTDAGCGEYVYDRLHPAVIRYPGITLYRQAHPPENVFYRRATGKTAPEDSTTMLALASGQLTLSRYSASPAPCQGPHCRQAPAMPEGQWLVVPIEVTPQNGVALADRPSDPSQPDLDNFLSVISERAPLQWGDRLYRPPG